ncbi:hypothetical protein [Hallella colorans]|uniref:hypothetical protein n=1 Tax=Hallella colorans TaxID=1703337 RepID=UPI00288989C7|nr:hypothetical protein [Hallella colorans]
MLLCTLDGKKGYPSTKNNIKVTLENPFVKDSGTYTYDIIFPMEIDANRRLFANVHRLDVKKTTTTFEQCLLYAGNRLVMQGKGIVTAITNDTVKVQIVGGKSRIKYNSKFENHYIDEIDYPPVTITQGYDKEAYARLSIDEPRMMKLARGGWLFVDLTGSNFVGQPGVAAFNPIWDETEDTCSNGIRVFEAIEWKVDGKKLGKGDRACMYNLAVQPNLMYVLRKIIESEGYTLLRNDYDKEPWNRLLVASATRSIRIKDALPHWTVYKFLDEIRKLFNATVFFDERERSVKIVSGNELLKNETVAYQHVETFTTEYDDDGVKNALTSNLRFRLGGSANRSWREVVSPEVLKEFDVKEGVVEFDKLGEREKRTTIQKLGGLYYVYADEIDEKHPDPERKVGQVLPCGFFNPIVRNEKSDQYEELCVAPVAITMKTLFKGKDALWLHGVGAEGLPNVAYCIPSTTNEKGASMKDMSVDEDGDYYLSVQNAIEGGIEKESNEGETADAMFVMFQGKKVSNRKVFGGTFNYKSTVDGKYTRYRAPVTYTDFRMYREYPGPGFDDVGSLSLHAIPGMKLGPFSTLGEFRSNVRVDAHHTIVIKFLTDDVPDPRKIYVFDNKRFICQKIELNVSDDGIEKEKTGYFCELL